MIMKNPVMEVMQRKTYLRVWKVKIFIDQFIFTFTDHDEFYTDHPKVHSIICKN